MAVVLLSECSGWNWKTFCFNKPPYLLHMTGQSVKRLHTHTHTHTHWFMLTSKPTVKQFRDIFIAPVTCWISAQPYSTSMVQRCSKISPVSSTAWTRKSKAEVEVDGRVSKGWTFTQEADVCVLHEHQQTTLTCKIMGVTYEITK